MKTIYKYIIFIACIHFGTCDRNNALTLDLRELPSIKDIPVVGCVFKDISLIPGVTWIENGFTKLYNKIPSISDVTSEIKNITLSIPGVKLVGNIVTSVGKTTTNFVLKIPGVSLVKNTVVNIYHKLPKLPKLSNFQINFENNACDHYWKYPISFVAPKCYKDANTGNLDLNSLANSFNFHVGYSSINKSDNNIVQRARFSSRDNVKSKNTMVVLIPGLTYGADVFLSTGNQSLMKQLVDDGYNVTVVSMRGTKKYYDNSVNRYQFNQSEYWDYNLDTIASIDYKLLTDNIVANEKGPRKLVYVTHSTGIIPLLMFASESKTAQKNIDGIIAMAPVALTKHAPSIIAMAYLYPKIQKILKILKIFGTYQLFFNATTLHKNMATICQNMPYLCLASMNLVFGKMSAFAPQYLLTYWNQVPDGISLQALDHLFQIVRAGQLQKYDYGKEKNKKIYNQATPPKYDLGQFKVNLLALYGKNDFLSTKWDIEKLFSMLGSSKKEIYPWTQDEKLQFNHISFLYSKNANEMINKPLSVLIQKHYS